MSNYQDTNLQTSISHIMNIQETSKRKKRKRSSRRHSKASRNANELLMKSSLDDPKKFLRP